MDYRNLLFVFVSLIVLAAGAHDLMIYLDDGEDEQEYSYLHIDYNFTGSWFSPLEKSQDITHFNPGNTSIVYFNSDSDEVVFIHWINFSSIKEENYREEYTVRMAVSDTNLENINDFEVYQVDSNNVKDSGNYIHVHSLSIDEIRTYGESDELLFRTAVSETGENPEFFGTHATVFLLQRELVFDRSQMEKPGFQ